MRRSILSLVAPMLSLACTDPGPSGDEVADDEGQGAGQPGPSGPGCAENWLPIDGAAMLPAIDLPEYQALAGSASVGQIELSARIDDELRPRAPEERAPKALRGPPIRWDEFVALHARRFASGWIVEGDLFLSDAQLEAVYHQYIGPASPSLLTFNAGIDEVWSGPRALELTWCVGAVLPLSFSNFPDAKAVQAKRYDRIVRGMQSAAREWERIANVNFIHLQEFDSPDSLQSGACQPGQNGIYFRVRMSLGGECVPPCTGLTTATPITEIQPEWASPENPGGWERELILSVSSATVESTMGITGRHELGHVLGFAHEHERFDLDDPPECEPIIEHWRVLTPEDTHSVMGYDICEGIATNQPRLSAYDRLGAFYQYNWSRRHALMMGGGSSVEDLAYDGSARAGIAWYRPLAHEIELWTSAGDPGTSLQFDVSHQCTAGGPAPCTGDDVEDLRMRPTPLLASGDARDLDVLLLGPGGNLDDRILRNDEGTFQPADFPMSGYAVPIVGSFESALDDELIVYRPGPSEDELIVLEEDGSSTSLAVNAPEFSIPLAGRFRGFEDGGNGILWWQPHTNVIETWLWDSLGSFEFVQFGPADTKSHGLADQAEYTPILGDFNGDDMTDMFWYAPGVRTDWLWESASSPDTVAFERYAHQVLGEYRPFPGDFDGDGIHDILWYSVADDVEGSVSVIWYFDEDGGHDVKTFTIHGDYSPVVADFDHDGCSDILWYDPATTDDSSLAWRCVPGELDFACDAPINHPSSGFPIGYGGAY